MALAGHSRRGARTERSWLLPVMLGTILILGLIPRIQRLDDISFWFDEASSWKMTTFSFAEIWERAARNVHPPLYYWLLKLWTMLAGDTPAALRLMSACFGLAAITGAWLLMAEAVGLRGRESTRDLGIAGGPAIVAAMLLAVSPLQIEWSVQARMYSLGAALAAFSGWSLLRALRPGTVRRLDWACYIVLAVLFLYAHNYALFTVATQLLFAVAVGIGRAVRRQSGPGRWNTLAAALLASVLVGTGWLPWWGKFLQQKQQVAQAYWIRPFEWEMVANTFAEFFSGSSAANPLFGWVIAELSLVAAMAAIVAGTRPMRLIAVCFVGPLLLSLAVSHFFRNIFLTRYLLYAHLYLLCLLAWGLCRIPIRGERALVPVAALVAASVLCAQHCQRREHRAEIPGLRTAITDLEAVRRRDEPVLVGNPMLHAAVLAHAKHRENIFTVGAEVDFPHYQGTPLMRHAEYRPREWLNGALPNRAWVVEGVRWNGGTWTVPMPDAWVAVTEVSYSEVYGRNCLVVVRRYERVLPTVPGSAGQTSRVSSDPL